MGEIRHEYRGRVGVLWPEIYLSARVTVTSCIFIGEDKSQYFENSSKLSTRPCKSDSEGRRERNKRKRKRESLSRSVKITCAYSVDMDARETRALIREQWNPRSAETPYNFRSKARYLEKAVVSGDKKSG